MPWRTSCARGLRSPAWSPGHSGRAKVRVAFAARAVVLCSGGVGHLYAVTTNPHEACGQGVGMAPRRRHHRRSRIRPVSSHRHRSRSRSGAARHRGPARRRSPADQSRWSPLHAGPASRRRACPARCRGARCLCEVAAGRGAFLDCRTAIGAHFADLFPTVHASCLSAGLDPATMPIRSFRRRIITWAAF